LEDFLLDFDFDFDFLSWDFALLLCLNTCPPVFFTNFPLFERIFRPEYTLTTLEPLFVLLTVHPMLLRFLDLEDFLRDLLDFLRRRRFPNKEVNRSVIFLLVTNKKKI